MKITVEIECTTGTDLLNEWTKIGKKIARTCTESTKNKGLIGGAIVIVGDSLDRNNPTNPSDILPCHKCIIEGFTTKELFD